MWKNEAIEEIHALGYTSKLMASKREMEQAVIQFILEQDKKGVKAKSSSTMPKGHTFVGIVTLATGERYRITDAGVELERSARRPSPPQIKQYNEPEFFVPGNGPVTQPTSFDGIGRFLESFTKHFRS